MTYNITGYIIYLIITSVIILFVGRVCYTNGIVFIKSFLKKNLNLSLQINKTLLVGYYLLNIGYATISIITWKEINNIKQLVDIISYKIGVIIIIISVLHYINIYVIKKILIK